MPTALRALVATTITAGMLAQGPPPADPQTESAPTVGERMFSLSRTWSMELPDGWRQLAPSEAHALRDSIHPDMLDPQPLRRYALGRVDRWLAEGADGGFDGVVLVIEEQGDELVHDESLPQLIRDHWAEQNSLGGIRHDVTSIAAITIGKEDYEALEVRRTVTFPDAPATECLDLYIPTDGKELMFSFRTPPAEAEAWQPRFREWLTTASFARPKRGQPTLTQRLFWPFLIGGTVALGLIFAHRAGRKRRM